MLTPAKSAARTRRRVAVRIWCLNMALRRSRGWSGYGGDLRAAHGQHGPARMVREVGERAGVSWRRSGSKLLRRSAALVYPTAVHASSLRHERFRQVQVRILLPYACGRGTPATGRGRRWWSETARGTGTRVGLAADWRETAVPLAVPRRQSRPCSRAHTHASLTPLAVPAAPRRAPASPCAWSREDPILRQTPSSVHVSLNAFTKPVQVRHGAVPDIRLR